MKTFYAGHVIIDTGDESRGRGSKTRPVFAFREDIFRGLQNWRRPKHGFGGRLRWAIETIPGKLSGPTTVRCRQRVRKYGMLVEKQKPKPAPPVSCPRPRRPARYVPAVCRAACVIAVAGRCSARGPSDRRRVIAPGHATRPTGPRVVYTYRGPRRAITVDCKFEKNRRAASAGSTRARRSVIIGHVRG